MSRFIFENVQVSMVEPKVSQRGTQYTKIHFTVMVTGRNGNTFPKQTNLACFDAQQAATVQPNNYYNLKGSIGVSQQGYPQLDLKTIEPTGTLPAQQATQQQAAPQQQAPVQNQAPAQAPQQNNGYAQMPQNPNQPAQQPAQQQAPAPSQTFDDDIPF